MYKAYITEYSNIKPILFVGGSPDNSKWNDIGNRLISKLEYALFNKKVCVQGYSQYNHIVTKHVSLSGECFISKIHLICAKEHSVKIFTWDIKKQCFYVEDKAFSEELKKLSGWKSGIYSNPKYIVY